MMPLAHHWGAGSCDGGMTFFHFIVMQGWLIAR